MSLDALIKKNRKSKLQQRRRKLNGDRPGMGRKNDRRSLNTRRNKDDGSKILVSNLEYKVTSKDLKDLFKDIGPVKSSAINYLPNGKSKGTGQVVFVRSNDAKRAINKYNNVELDGRPMKIEMVLNPFALNGKSSIRSRSNRMRRRRRNRNEPLKTQEELDAEMDSYMKIDDNMSAQPQSNTEGNTSNSAIVA